MRVLITGVAGFIGSHLGRALLERGAAVVGVDNLDAFGGAQRKFETLTELKRFRRFDFVRSDVRDPALSVPGQVTAVVHLAARAGVRDSLRDPLGYAAVNVGGTAAILHWCTRHEVPRLVVASSSSVYGDIAEGPAREDQRLAPQSPYAASKLAAEHLCRAEWQARRLRIAVLRFFSVYGPGQRPDQGMRRFARALIAGEPVVVRGDGRSERDYTHVADVVAGVLAALEWTDGAPGYEVVNLGSGAPVRLREVVERMAGALGVADPIVLREAWHNAEPQRTHADLTKARRLFAYEPTRSVAEGIAEFAIWSERTHGGQRIAAARAS